MIGGDGQDLIEFAGRWRSLEFDLATGEMGSPRQVSVSGVEHVNGHENAETLRGDDAANRLDGRGGDDRLTGRAGENFRQLTSELGADAYIIKPFKDRELFEQIEKFIDYRAS